jgi:hypothetical protein
LLQGAAPIVQRSEHQLGRVFSQTLHMFVAEPICERTSYKEVNEFILGKLISWSPKWLTSFLRNDGKLSICQYHSQYAIKIVSQAVV